MGSVSPKPPQPPPLIPDGSKPPISVAEETTFDAWMALPAEDKRTLAEYAANPVPLVRRLPGPPLPPLFRRENRRAEMLELPPALKLSMTEEGERLAEVHRLELQAAMRLELSKAEIVEIRTKQKREADDLAYYLTHGR